jgi:asparagine synthase (glutamine-hydrolysing)
MQLTSDPELAKSLAARSEAVLFNGYDSAHAEPNLRDDLPELLIGRRYQGLFDANDGSYVAVRQVGKGVTTIDRDCYGAIPLFYSLKRPLISTDIRLILDIENPSIDLEGLAEYLSAAYVTGGRTIFENIRFLMPNETISVKDGILTVEKKAIFPAQVFRTEQEVSDLLEQAINRSLESLLSRELGPIQLNLSGGADSTLLLAKICEMQPGKTISTTTYFHDDWRDDLDDWRYAEQASQQFKSRHQLVKINNETFCSAHRELLKAGRNVFHTYAAAFYAQNKAVSPAGDVPIINGSGPDESIIGTEKIPVKDLLALRSLKREQWVDYLIANIDYIKIPEASANAMLLSARTGFVEARRRIATELMDSENFVEFQRRYHALTVLQDHVHELNAVAQVLGRRIVFPFLTNDIFRIIFSTSFETLNAGGVYKSVVKNILRKVMPEEFVYRKKIGFQSPSRPYFMSKAGLGRELSRLLSTRNSALLNMKLITPAIQTRLNTELDLHRRYDFLEWTAYNILCLEESRGARG